VKIADSENQVEHPGMLKRQLSLGIDTSTKTLHHPKIPT
jgi:hypothetical protein